MKFISSKPFSCLDLGLPSLMKVISVSHGPTYGNDVDCFLPSFVAFLNASLKFLNFLSGEQILDNSE